MCSRRNLRENSLDYIIPDFATSSETYSINYLSNKNRNANNERQGYLFYWPCLTNQDTLIKLYVSSGYLRNTADRSRKTKFVILFLIALCPLFLQTTQAAPMPISGNSQLQQHQEEIDLKMALKPAYNNSNRIADIFKKTFIDNKTIEQDMEHWSKWLPYDLEKIIPHIEAIEKVPNKDILNRKEIYDIVKHLTTIVDYLLSAYDEVLRDLKAQTDGKNASFYNVLLNLRNKVRETQSYLHPVIQIIDPTYNFKKPKNVFSNDIQTVKDMPLMRFLNLHKEINKIILDIFKTKLGQVAAKL